MSLHAPRAGWLQRPLALAGCSRFQGLLQASACKAVCEHVPGALQQLLGCTVTEGQYTSPAAISELRLTAQIAFVVHLALRTPPDPVSGPELSLRCPEPCCSF